jgi:hypothetical protein
VNLVVRLVEFVGFVGWLNLVEFEFVEFEFEFS